MWIVIAVVVIVLVALGVVAGPMLMWKGLPDGVSINCMFLVKDGFVSACVVPLGEDEAALVDAGNDPEGKAILAELSRSGYGPEDVKVILLTHGHSDHTAAVAKFPNAQVMALEEEADVVEGRSFGGGPIMLFRSPKRTGIRLARRLRDGEVLPVGPYQVRVFAVPGHTPGSAAYAIGENLFLGDSANQGKDGRLKPAPWIFTGSTAENRKSLVGLARRLADDTTIKGLIFGHTAPFENGLTPLIEFARRG